jgi:hypothetical protein
MEKAVQGFEVGYIVAREENDTSFFTSHKRSEIPAHKYWHKTETKTKDKHKEKNEAQVICCLRTQK